MPPFSFDTYMELIAVLDRLLLVSFCIPNIDNVDQ